MTPATVALTWVARHQPLVPRAAAASGAARERLLRRLRELPEGRLERLQAVSGENLLVILGAAEDLPWVEGLVYLGRSDEAPSLLLPTAVEPSLPVALLERALRRRAGTAVPPLVVVPELGLLASAAEARPLTAESIGSGPRQRPTDEARSS